MPTMPVAGKKRKMGGDKKEVKYYGVRAGTVPGVYSTWGECQNQISGFKGASFKSFLSFADAQSFVQGGNPEGAGPKNKGDKFYAVARGHRTGIFSTWEEASLAIKGASRPKYKKFASKGEAEAFMRMYSGEQGQDAMGGEEEEFEEDDAEVAAPAAKKVKTAVKSAAKSEDTVSIWTDGSSLANGTAGATAGVGVWFGFDDERNISEPLQGTPQTNQRAELTAILRALQSVPHTQSVQIYTDSQYSIKCCTEWYKSWVKNGWKATSGGQVKNKDLVAGIREVIDERDEAGARTALTWVKGHADNLGNQQADILAVQGSRRG